MDNSNQARPADFLVRMNRPPPDVQVKNLRTALAREKALQDHLEQQRIGVENEASKAQDIVSSLVTCHAASERVHQLLGTLRAAVTESKDLMSNTINVHDTEPEATDKLATTTAAARTAWGGLIQLLEALTPQINATIDSTQSHTLNAYSQVCTYKFLAECTRNSITALDVSLDAISTSLSIKRGGLSSIFCIPNEVFGMIFQFAVEEEREQLRAEFSSSSFSFESRDDMTRTIPKCPFTLAAVCHGWRNIARDTPKLWSYIRVYTSLFITSRIIGSISGEIWVGKAAFETSIYLAKKTPLELVIYEGVFDQMQISQHIPPDARISVIYLVRLASVPRWLPSCSCLSLVGDDAPDIEWDYDFTIDRDEIPSFLTGPKEISCDNVLPRFPTPLDSTTAFYFCSGISSEISLQTPYLDQLSEKLPNLEYLQLLQPDVSAPSVHSTTTVPRTWKSLTTLSITSSVLPSFAALAQQGLSLPSLTTLILSNVFASFSLKECDNIKDVVRTLTSLEIHHIAPSVKSSELRSFIDWMECLQTVTLHRASVQKVVKALGVPPAKSIQRLVIEDTVLEEVDYTALLLDGSDTPEPRSSPSSSSSDLM